MPKRHRQPEPLQTSQKQKQQQQKQEQQQERIEDYGDDPQEQVSCSSDEFHSSDMGDDGNASSTAESLNDDTDSSPMMMGSDNDDDDDDDASLINVDFGVFEMKPRDVDAVMHLMDQLCPDKMNEVDRDELGAALHASPFTCVVKIGSDDDDDGANDEDEGDNDNDNDNKDGDAEEEEEIYGMASILDVAHEPRLGLLLQLLKSGVWRTVAPGILPTDMLTSVDDATGKAKCVLLVGEYIRNVPLELTSHILSDLVERFEAAFNPKSSAAAAATTATALEAAKTTVQATFPCMFALLSKIQRAVDVPVTTAKTTSGATKHEPPQKKKRRQSTTQQEEFDMSRYIFWREEDSILYEYRDKRIATVAYRCRPQYDTQPENDLPVSILYVVPYGGLLQAVAEMKKRESTQANVVRY